MLVKQLFVLASIGLAAVNAQNFQFKETYPEPYTVPKPKAEWLNLIKNAKITNAPPLTTTSSALVMPNNAAEDPYCTWSFSQCLGPDDVYTCPKGSWTVSFDDGPSEYTPKLLDFLKEKNEKVTFFVVGGQVLKYPETLKRAYDEGHEIAMHSWSHKNMATLTNEELVGELKWTELAIKEVIGVSPRYFRPPFGNIDNRVRDIIKALGFTPVIWSVDTNDWYLTEHADTFDSNWITGNVTQWAATAEGGNSLAHDLYEETVAASLDYIPVLADAFELKTVGECNTLSSYTNGNGTAINKPEASKSSSAVPTASETSKSQDDKDTSVKAQENADQESGASSHFVASSSAAALMVAAIAAVMAN
ncbi:hypothetical protein BDC45DRAFT_430956 [Circinella umbellata]|nr:hypothetical protein BDC45DRAFT_430956 [Circinella umbellata]